MIRALLFLLPLALSAQHITYSTGGAQDLSAVAWRISACTTGPAVNLPFGLFFQHLALHGAKPLLNSEALQVFNEAPSRSIAGRLVEYSGWAAVGAGVLMTTDQIKVRQEIKVAVNFGGAFLSVLVPLVRQKVPPVSVLRDALIGAWLPVPSGGCASGVVLGSATGANDFEVTL